MAPQSLILSIGITASLMLSALSSPSAAQDQPVATFKSGVELVRVSAVVRDKKGRFVQNLTIRDFEIFDAGIPRPITEFRKDTGAISVALLFDVSGSMEDRLEDARDAARHVLSWLDKHDEAAVFSFDTRLAELVPFTTGLKHLPARLDTIEPFGATSLHDAIGETAERLADRPGLRRAVVVFTDGVDTASRRRPEEVSAVASAIDVPVYIFATVPGIDNPTLEHNLISATPSPLAGELADLASWTGGHAFVASIPATRSAAARQIVDELRQLYLIAFASSGRPGWHPLVVRARGKDLTVRARSGYHAGQSRPIS